MERNPIEIQKHLKGASYPADRDELASLAEQNGADEDLVQEIRSLDVERFDGPDDVMKALDRAGV